jgi:hypothetical protein
MSTEKKIEIKLIRIIGSKEPFYAQGNYRISLPKAFVRKYAHLNPNQSINQCGLEDISFIFIETNKGVLIRPLSEVMEDPEMRGLCFAPTAGMTLKELSKLIDEIAEE